MFHMHKEGSCSFDMWVWKMCQTTALKNGAYHYDAHFWLGKDTSQVLFSNLNFFLYAYFLCLLELLPLFSFSAHSFVSSFLPFKDIAVCRVL